MSNYATIRYRSSAPSPSLGPSSPPPIAVAQSSNAASSARRYTNPTFLSNTFTHIRSSSTRVVILRPMDEEELEEGEIRQDSPVKQEERDDVRVKEEVDSIKDEDEPSHNPTADNQVAPRRRRNRVRRNAYRRWNEENETTGETDIIGQNDITVPESLPAVLGGVWKKSRAWMFEMLLRLYATDEGVWLA